MSKTTAWALRGSFMVGGTILLVDGYRSRRRLRRRRFLIGEQMEQRALDRGLPRRRVDLRAEQVGDVEHVAGALAEGRDMGRGDVEVELRNRRRQLIQKAWPVEAGHLDHGVTVRPLIVDGHFRLDRERPYVVRVVRAGPHR